MPVTPPPASGSSQPARALPAAAPVPYGALAALCALAVATRVIGLDSGLWIDEIYSLERSFRASYATIITGFWGDNHHPLYAVLAHVCWQVFGESAWAVRLPALVFGVACIPATWSLARRVTSPGEGLLAAALLAVSYHHVWFSQNARGYTMMAFFALTATSALLRAVESREARHAFAYALLAALGAYTHLTMVFVVIGHCVAVLLHRALGSRMAVAEFRALLLPFVMAALVTLVLYAPMLSQVVDFFLHRPSAMRGISTPLWAFVETLRVLLLGVGVQTVLLGGVVLVAGMVVLLAGVRSVWQSNRLAALLFVVPVLTTIAGALFGRGTMYPRFFFFMAGIAAIVLVRGLVVSVEWTAARLRPVAPRLQGRPLARRVTLAVIVVSAAGLPLNYRFPKQDFGGAMRYVLAEQRDADRVAFAGVPGEPFRVLYGLAWPTLTQASQLEGSGPTGRTWVIYTFPRYLERSAPELADRLRRECRTQRVFRGTVGGGDIVVCTVEAP